MSAKVFSYLAGIIFLALAGLQALRAYSGWPAVIDDYPVPVSLSWGISAILVVLAILGFTAKR